MGLVYLVYLESQKTRAYKCAFCGTDLAYESDFYYLDLSAISGNKSYMFRRVFNLFDGVTQEVVTISGKHKGCHVYCRKCSAMLGWRYIDVEEM